MLLLWSYPSLITENINNSKSCRIKRLFCILLFIFLFPRLWLTYFYVCLYEYSVYPIFKPPDVKYWLIGKDPDAGKDRRQEEKGMATQWTWVWASSGSWWRTVKPGVLQSMGSQRVRHDWMTELNKTLLQSAGAMTAVTKIRQKQQQSRSPSHEHPPPPTAILHPSHNHFVPPWIWTLSHFGIISQGIYSDSLPAFLITLKTINAPSESQRNLSSPRKVVLEQ